MLLCGLMPEGELVQSGLWWDLDGLPVWEDESLETQIELLVLGAVEAESIG